MKRSLLFVALLASSAAVRAGDKPLIVPEPAWVKKVEAAPNPAAPGEAPVSILLADAQLRINEGTLTVFNRTILRVDQATGLAAGNLSLPWRPDVGDLSVHRLVIRRGATVIDVLQSGQGFTVARREPNLEMATLDGVLTANIQPEGLEVGDVLELATSVTVRDPVMAGHVEDLVAIGGSFPIGRAHFRASWPAKLPVRMRTSGPIKPPTTTSAGADRVVETTVDGVVPFQSPKLAPPRFQVGRLVELSDFASWADMGALMAPLYVKAATVPATGPLADEIAKIRNASADPVVRTTAALSLVQNRVRYVALSMGSGGLLPADAAMTWTRRYGDCKAKTALLLAILGQLGIDAVPVAVNATAGDGIDERLPAIGVFNHVLVRAMIAGRTYWLDGTRIGDTALERLTVPNVGWGLPLIAKGAALVRMVAPPRHFPTSEVSVAIDASEGLSVPAPVEVTNVLRGDEAVAFNAALANLATGARDAALREMLKRQYDFIDFDTVKTAFDPATGELRLTAMGKARMDWTSGWYETDGLGLGYKANLKREPGFGSDAPYAVVHPRFGRSTETIKLPIGFSQSLTVDKASIERTVGGVEYRRTAVIKDRVFRGEASERSLAAEFPASEAGQVEKALREMSDATVYLRKPPNYIPTKAELALSLKNGGALTTLQLIDRGHAFLERNQLDEALADFNAAVAAEPTNARALSDRGITLVWKGDKIAANRDLDAAERLNPRDAVIFRARGLLAEQDGDFRRALPLWTKALELEPGNGFALAHRVAAYRAVGDHQAALKDTDTILALNPTASDTRLIRFNILRNQGKIDEAMAELRAGITAAPGETFPYVAAANAAIGIGRRDEGMRFYEQALAIKREAYIYLNRANWRLKADETGRLADIDAALALDPSQMEAILAKAELLRDRGDAAGAIALYDRAVAAKPDRGDVVFARGLAKVRLGQEKAAQADLAAAAAWAKGSANRLNSLCWGKATSGVLLSEALTDCDASIAIEPASAATLDSKGLVLLRLGRASDAVRAYDQALTTAPQQAASLFGRSVAHARLGDRVKADADRAAALAMSPEIERQFADFGVTR